MIWKTVVWCHFMFISYLLMTFYEIFAEASIASRGGYFEIELEGIHNSQRRISCTFFLIKEVQHFMQPMVGSWIRLVVKWRSLSYEPCFENNFQKYQIMKTTKLNHQPPNDLYDDSSLFIYSYLFFENFLWKMCQSSQRDNSNFLSWDLQEICRWFVFLLLVTAIEGNVARVYAPSILTVALDVA